MLRCLDALRVAEVELDPRMEPALEIVRGRHRRDPNPGMVCPVGAAIEPAGRQLLTQQEIDDRRQRADVRAEVGGTVCPARGEQRRSLALGADPRPKVGAHLTDQVAARLELHRHVAPEKPVEHGVVGPHAVHRLVCRSLGMLLAWNAAGSPETPHGAPDETTGE
ncbi:MAG: hypothetical protein V9G19_05360 [Tetrasphaera sp.]